MINPSAVATLGIGYGARSVATLGFLQVSVSKPVVAPSFHSGGGGSLLPSHYRFPSEIEPAENFTDDDIEMLLMLMAVAVD